jgi:hypothetical protein
MVRDRREHDRPGATSLIAIAALLLAGSLTAEGQVVVVGRQPTGAISGTVVAQDDQTPVPFALVRLPTLGVERFADGSGSFRLSAIPAGPYQLVIMQTGHSARDTIVWIDTGSVASPRIRLPESPPALADLTPAPPGACTAPQDVVLHAPLAFTSLLDQVIQNGERFRVLSASYPFAARYERVLTELSHDGASTVLDTDTTIMRSTEVPRYRPGDVARLALRAAREQDYAIRIPTLADVGNPEFQRTHCFSYAGIESFAGEPLARVDFTVAEWIDTPDVSGAVFLDTLTFQVRGMTAALTRIPLRGVERMEVTTLFRELAPNLAIPTQVSATTEYRAARLGRDSYPAARTETQWLIEIAFFGRQPGGPEQQPR